MEVKNLLIIISITLVVILVLAILLGIYYTQACKFTEDNKSLKLKTQKQESEINNLRADKTSLKNEVETLKEMLSIIPKEGSEQLAGIFGSLAEKFAKVHDNLKDRNANDLSLVLSQVEQDLSINSTTEKEPEYTNIPEFLKTKEKSVIDSQDDTSASQEEITSEEEITSKP